MKEKKTLVRVCECLCILCVWVFCEQQNKMPYTLLNQSQFSFDKFFGVKLFWLKYGFSVFILHSVNANCPECVSTVCVVCVPIKIISENHVILHLSLGTCWNCLHSFSWTWDDCVCVRCAAQTQNKSTDDFSMSSLRWSSNSFIQTCLSRWWISIKTTGSMVKFPINQWVLKLRIKGVCRGFSLTLILLLDKHRHTGN